MEGNNFVVASPFQDAIHGYHAEVGAHQISLEEQSLAGDHLNTTPASLPFLSAYYTASDPFNSADYDWDLTQSSNAVPLAPTYGSNIFGFDSTPNEHEQPYVNDSWPPLAHSIDVPSTSNHAILGSSLSINDAYCETSNYSGRSLEQSDYCQLNLWLHDENRFEKIALGLSTVHKEEDSFEQFRLDLPDVHNSASFLCDHCQKRFPRASDLNKHTKYHTKPLSCTFEGCESAFARRQDLERHVSQRHTNKRDGFFCPHPGCSRGERGLGRENGFNRRDHLRQHLRHVHEDHG